MDIFNFFLLIYWAITERIKISNIKINFDCFKLWEKCILSMIIRVEDKLFYEPVFFQLEPANWKMSNILRLHYLLEFGTYLCKGWMLNVALLEFKVWFNLSKQYNIFLGFQTIEDLFILNTAMIKRNSWMVGKTW